MAQDLMPLFLQKLAGEKELKPIGAIVTSDGEAYKASSFISGVAEEIEDDVEALLDGSEMGEITIAAYILLESLHRAKMGTVATQMISDPASLLNAAIYTAVGMRAGMKIPEGTKFETTASDSDFSIRDVTDGEGEESN